MRNIGVCFDIIFLRGHYWIYLFSEDTIYSKTPGIENPKIFFKNLNDNITFSGRTLFTVMNNSCLGVMRDKDLTIIEITKNFNRGKFGNIITDRDNVNVKSFDQDKIGVLTIWKNLKIFEIWIGEDKIEFKKLADVKVNGLGLNDEKSFNFLVDQIGRFLMIGMCESGNSSSISVFKISKNFNLELKSVYDLRGMEIGLLNSLRILRNSDDTKGGFYFFGIEILKVKRKIEVFWFDGKEEVRREERDWGIVEFEGELLKFEEVGCMRYTGVSHNGNVVEIDFSFEEN